MYVPLTCNRKKGMEKIYLVRRSENTREKIGQGSNVKKPREKLGWRLKSAT